MQYRKKPVVIEAVVFSGDRNWNEAPEWLIAATKKGRDEVGALHVFPPTARIMTLEGPMNASAGDFIIRGVKGELYACKPDIFAATYEEVSDLANQEISPLK